MTFYKESWAKIQASTAICFVFLTLHKQTMCNSSSWMTMWCWDQEFMDLDSNVYCKAFTGRTVDLSHSLETCWFLEEFYSSSSSIGFVIRQLKWKSLVLVNPLFCLSLEHTETVVLWFTLCQETFCLSAQCASSLLMFSIAFIRLVKFNVILGYSSGNLNKSHRTCTLL